MDIKFTKTIESWILAAKNGDTSNAQQLFQSTESIIQDIRLLKEKEGLSEEEEQIIEKLSLIASKFLSELEEIETKESLPNLIKNLNGDSKEKPATEIFCRLINNLPIKDPLKNKNLVSYQQKLLEISQGPQWEIKENKLILHPLHAQKLTPDLFWSEIQNKLLEKDWEKLEIKGMGEMSRERLEDCIRYHVSLAPEKLFSWQKKMDSIELWLKEGFTSSQMSAITGSLEHYPIKEKEKGSDPTAPIEFAIILGHVHVAEALLKEGASLDFLTPEGVRQFVSHDKEMLQLLAKKGFNLDKIDQHGQTLLSQAILSKDQEFAKILLEIGSNPLTLNKNGIAPFTLAAAHNQTEVLKILIEKGGSKFTSPQGSPTPMETLYFLRFNHPHEFKPIAQSLKLNDPLLLKQHKEQFLIKTLAHSTEQKGNIQLNPINQEASTLSIPKEGGVPYFWLHKMAKATELMQKPDLNLLTETLNFSSTTKTQVPSEILSRIQEGLPVILSTGYEGHNISVLLWGDYFVLCNRGESSRAPIEIYKYDKEKIDENTIKSIQNSVNGDVKNYKNLFFEELPKSLSFKQGETEKAIQKGCSLPDQKVGNCSWASPETAVWALRSLQNIFGEEKGKLKNISPSTTEIIQTLTKGKKEFRSWLVSNQLYHIERYIKRKSDNKGKNIYPLDKKSIDQAFQNSRNIKDADIEPPFSEKRTKLFEYYNNTFLKPLGLIKSFFTKELKI